MSNTPETDKVERMAYSQEYMVETEFARKLERERDEAQADCLEQARLLGMGSEREARLISERDDALSQIAQAECRAERFCQERDEAREAFVIATDQMVQAQCKLRETDKERQAFVIAQQEVITNLILERDEALSQIAQAECRAERFCQERDEAREEAAHWKSEWEIVEARLCGWKHPRDNGITFEHEVIPVLRKERDEARDAILGWENKWRCAVDMAARAEIERDDALNKLKELKDILR